jgi:hypothetical protein
MMMSDDLTIDYYILPIYFKMGGAELLALALVGESSNAITALPLWGLVR